MLVFSVALNIALVGAAVYHLWALRDRASAPGNQPFLYQQLKLTDEQLKRFKPMEGEFHAHIARIGSEIKARQLQLIDLLADAKPDRVAIQAKQDEIRGLQRGMHDAVIDHLIDGSSMFTPEQRAAFFKLMKERIRRAGSPRPPWLGSSPETAGSEGGK
jgi:Spy/CpxP family protein refolding chaperone